MATGGQAESWSDEYIEYPCSVCKQDQKVSDSGHYCLICKGFLCATCLSGHKKYTSGHQVIAVTDKKFQNVLTERCVDHPGEVTEHYCAKHDVLLCNTCKQLGHRKCKNVKQLSDAANKLIADPKLQAVPDQLKSTLDRVTRVIDTIDSYVVNVQKKGHTYLKDLENYERILIAKIRELTAKGRNSIIHAQNLLISAANERRKDCAKTKELMSKILDEVKRSQTRKAHLVILKKKGQGLVNRAEDLCRESEDSIKNTPFFYKPDTQIVESFNGFRPLVTEIEQYTIGHMGDINTKVSVDTRESIIWECGRLGDGTLVVYDYNNNRLKRVDPCTNKVVDYCMIEACSLCIIGPQEVAVADGSNIVNIISAVKGLTPSRTVDMGQKTNTLACHGGELFAGCGDSLRIHDMSGKIITDISRNTDDQSIFSSTTGIAVNQAGDRVYVIDSNGLVCVFRDGRVVFRLSNDDMGLVRARGVTTDHRGMVMVVGLDSDNVVQVTDEGRVVGEILAGIWSPGCVSFDVDGRKLYVGAVKSLLGFELL